MPQKTKKTQWLFESLDFPYESVEIRSALKIKKKLYLGKSSFQKIEVFDTFSFGRVLVLDGIFQTSEKDEFIYHEMLCHLPMFYHRNPQKVLIVGGGDGGALEEVLKHPVKKAWMVEIDRKATEVSKKYLSSISKGAFNSKKAEVIIEDGLKFIKNFKNFFDVIILDLSDPWGPAEKLISTPFYRDVKKALRKGGVISVQSGSLTCQSSLVALIKKRLKKVFSFVKVHHASVPLYGVGAFSLTVASDINLEKFDLNKAKQRIKRIFLKTKYYSPEIHFSSQVLPKIYDSK